MSLAGDLPVYNRSIIEVLQPDGSTEFRAQRQTNAALNLQMSQRLPVTGGSFFISSALSRLEVNGERDIRNYSSTPLSVGIRQDILRPNAFKWDGREQDLRSRKPPSGSISSAGGCGDRGDAVAAARAQCR
ncbi:MAG: hypothetical protein IPK33_11300 [Gemmatimonadetes bacterium]|nr:hypothetical protein [Gemmatimonadota bacterium]